MKDRKPRRPRTDAEIRAMLSRACNPDRKFDARGVPRVLPSRPITLPKITIADLETEEDYHAKS